MSRQCGGFSPAATSGCCRRSAAGGTRFSPAASSSAGGCGVRRRGAVRFWTSGCSSSTWVSGSRAGRRPSASPPTWWGRRKTRSRAWRPPWSCARTAGWSPWVGAWGLWLAGWPAPKRVAAHMVGQAKDSVEDMATALVVCENGVSISMDVSWRHLGAAERFWFDLVGTKGSATVQPLRVFKEAHGTVVDATPTGASGRETPFAQSYRAEWTYFLAVIRGDVNAPPPRDQLALHRVLDAVYRSADEGRDVLL